MKLSEFEMLLAEQARKELKRSVNKADVSAVLKALAVTLREPPETGRQHQPPWHRHFQGCRTCRTHGAQSPHGGTDQHPRPQAGKVRARQEPFGGSERGSKMNIVRSEEEIARLENWAAKGFDEGSHYPGMTYEQGIMDTLSWLCGDNDVAPDEEG